MAYTQKKSNIALLLKTCDAEHQKTFHMYSKTRSVLSGAYSAVPPPASVQKAPAAPAASKAKDSDSSDSSDDSSDEEEEKKVAGKRCC